MNLFDEIHLIAREHLTNIKKSGPNNIMATCPFHRKPDGSEEKSPSFSMSLINGLWLCFACHETGNLRTFLRSVGVSHFIIEHQYRALLDEAAHAIPKRLDPLRPNVLTETPLPESLLGIFEFCPLDLLKEGFTEETLERFDVGFDKTHMRITYPIRDLNGQLFAISGRTVTNAEPRYKVYDKEYPTWGLPSRADGDTKKRATLWNADRVYPLTLNRTDCWIVLVESFKACMWVYQAGITNVVALIGSFMSEEQHWILERMGAKVYLMLDNDEAGLKGTHFIGKKLAKSLDARVVVYGDTEDRYQPDLISPEEVHEAMESTVDYFKWLRA